MPDLTTREILRRLAEMDGRTRLTSDDRQALGAWIRQLCADHDALTQRVRWMERAATRRMEMELGRVG